jgi:hypothetical protein
LNLDEVRYHLKAHGLARTAADLALRVVNRVALLHFVLAIDLERSPEQREPGLPPELDYRFGKLDEATLRRFVHLPGYELSDAFLTEAFLRGDECYGFLLGSELAAYCWYTRLPTSVGLPGVALRFGAGWVHIYKGLTHPDHRGRHLHSRGLREGLAIQRARGAKGLVSYVDLTSFGARRSIERAGFRVFGGLVLTRLFGRHYAWASRECRRRDFSLDCAQPGPGGARRQRPVTKPPNGHN